MLSFSGWTYVALAASETFEALVAGLQGAVWTLGAVPSVIRHDNLSAATHELKRSVGRQLTERFREYANARVVEPLSRSRARAIVAGARQLADRINNEWARNPLEISALAPFGNYLSQDPALESLPLGIVVRIRPATRRARWRMLTKADGAHEIRGAFKALSSFVRAQLCTELAELPPPFAVVYQAYEDDL